MSLTSAGLAVSRSSSSLGDLMVRLHTLTFHVRVLQLERVDPGRDYSMNQSKLMVACKPDSLNISSLASVLALQSRQLPVNNRADTESLTPHPKWPPSNLRLPTLTISTRPINTVHHHFRSNLFIKNSRLSETLIIHEAGSPYFTASHGDDRRSASTRDICDLVPGANHPFLQQRSITDTEAPSNQPREPPHHNLQRIPDPLRRPRRRPLCNLQLHIRQSRRPDQDPLLRLPATVQGPRPATGTALPYPAPRGTHRLHGDLWAKQDAFATEADRLRDHPVSRR